MAAELILQEPEAVKSVQTFSLVTLASGAPCPRSRMTVLSAAATGQTDSDLNFERGVPAITRTCSGEH